MIFENEKKKNKEEEKEESKSLTRHTIKSTETILAIISQLDIAGNNFKS